MRFGAPVPYNGYNTRPRRVFVSILIFFFFFFTVKNALNMQFSATALIVLRSKTAVKKYAGSARQTRISLYQKTA